MSRSKRIAQAGLVHLGIASVTMTTAQAAAYLNYSTATFRAKVKDGKLPPPIPGTNNRWDRRTLDQHMKGRPPADCDPIMEMIERAKG